MILHFRKEQWNSTASLNNSVALAFDYVIVFKVLFNTFYLSTQGKFINYINFQFLKVKVLTSLAIIFEYYKLYPEQLGHNQIF